MNVLVVDAGGRGNAIAHAFSRSEKVRRIFVAPGNAGSDFFEKCSIAKIEGKQIQSIRSIEEIISFAKKNVDIAFIGPEEPLSLGIVDRLEEEGIPTVGPRKELTWLEASKCKTKDFLNNLGVPIPAYRNFYSAEEAKEFIKNSSGSLVVKADGLAAGKGVYVCESVEEALRAVEEIMVEKKFGQSGDRVVIEEKLSGVEIAFTAICDGKNAISFGNLKDYKSAFDLDDFDGLRDFYIGLRRKFYRREEIENLFRNGKLINPNTGGMGAISPHPEVDEEVEDRIMKKVVKPVVKATGFKGILYPVIMLVDGEPKVLEINIRECDPGAQAKFPRLKSDLLEISLAIVEGRIQDISLEFSSDFCCAVCAVSGALKGREGFKPGYPADHYTNQPIIGVEEARKIAEIYVNGMAKQDGYVTTGGRVLTVVGRGKTIKEARDRAYSALKLISFPGMRYRKSLGLEYVSQNS
ncbi:MAG: phosphoribosylamine--glycine ligase [Archaeoglobaceae archaeon]|nr:phosphoribosylamine--glycine ligase [Archaeoglobaceae archaeon]MDW7989762.1 phosphoribosylamine--glycine ligase [Archaeoglobaceae archaeon]